MQPIEKKARLDRLPVNILAKIASYLPIKQAVFEVPGVSKIMRATILKDNRYALALNRELHDLRGDQV